MPILILPWNKKEPDVTLILIAAGSSLSLDCEH